MMTSAEWVDRAEAHRPRRFLLESVALVEVLRPLVHLVAPVVALQRVKMTKLKIMNKERD